MFDLINKVISPYGVSGSEEPVRNVIENLIKPYVDETRTDALGNLITVKRIQPGPEATGSQVPEKIMFAAHMDTIGVIATYTDEKGFLRFSPVGGISPHVAIGQRVIFQNGTCGIVYYEEEIENMKDLKFSKMFIDIGAGSREEALSKVKTGDRGFFFSQTVLQGDHVISSYLDDRAGCAVLIGTAQKVARMAQEGLLKNKEIYFVFTVQEELGLRGSGPAAFGIVPDAAVAVDVTDTGDIPGCRVMEVSLGKGPAIKIKDKSVICHPYVKERLKATAELLGIPYQFEIMEDGGTDAGAIHKAAGGIVTGGVSIPARYIHTPHEMCSLKDMEQIVELLAGFSGAK